MIRSLRALAWMRFRLFINSMKRTGRRDTLEQVSRAVAGVLPVVLLIALVPSVLALSVAGFYCGRMLAAGHAGSEWWLAGMRLGFVLVILMVGLLPLLRGAGGGQSGLTRLLVLPIPRRALLGSEILAGFGDPWLGLAVPFLLGIPLGLAIGGAPLAALTALVAGAALLLTLGALNALCSLGMTLLFRNRRRGELLTIFGVCLVFLIPAGTARLDEGLVKRHVEEQPADGPASPPTPAGLVDRLIPPAARVLPGELYVGALRAGLPGEVARFPIGLLGLLAWSAAVTAGAATLFRRLLESPGGSSRRVSARKAARLRRYPGLSPAASAVALTTVRATLRTVRGKIAVYLNVGILGVLLAVLGTKEEMRLPEDSWVGLGQLGALGGMVLSALSMHPVMLNLFATDRSGLTRQFLAPISIRDIALGKMAAGTGLIALSSAMCAALAFAVSPGGSVVGWLALVLVFVSSHLLLGPLSVLLSAMFPKASDLSRLGKAGNPHALAGLLGLLLVLLATAPPALMAALALFWLDRPLLALVLPAAWTAIAALISVPLFRLAVAAVGRRADNLMLVATGR